MALKDGAWTEIAKAISRCDELLMATLDGDAEKVAEIVEQAHDTYTSVLKYNKSADSAIRQIKEKRYHGALEGYSDRILLVGINYDADGKDKKHHTCIIEEWN